MRNGSNEYANEADDDDVPKPAQSLGTPVPRQKVELPQYTIICTIYHENIYHDILYITI